MAAGMASAQSVPARCASSPHASTAGGRITARRIRPRCQPGRQCHERGRSPARSARVARRVNVALVRRSRPGSPGMRP